MYAKGKGSQVPSDNQAREKLALYVYEYLLHVGAQKAAQTFLSEIRWEKNITLGEPPGFLHSWWCVFWDLYCAAPERRDTCEHSSEAKAFHDYNPKAPSPLGQMGPMNPNCGGMRPPGPGMGPGGPGPGPGGPMPPMSVPGGPGARPWNPNASNMNYSSASPGGPHGPYGGPPVSGAGGPGTPIMPSPQGPPGMNPMNPRMNAPRGQPMGPMNPNYGGMRPPGPGMGPGGPGPGPGGPMPPMLMPGPGGRPWNPNASNMNYSSASPGGPHGPYGGPPVSGAGGPGTPIMPSPQGPYSPANHRIGTPNPGRDSSSSGGDGMYPMMKPVPGGNMGPVQQQQFGMGPEGPMGPMGGPEMGPPVMNGMSSGPGDGMEMKNSPANGPSTPREDGPSMGDYGIPGYGGENNESAAILKIKESMQEEAKRFEKEAPPDHPDYFMQ